MSQTKPTTAAPAPSVKKRPSCFGDLKKVCPRDEEGIMQPQVECLPCELLRSCLQHGLRQEGVIPRPFSESPVASKVSGFLKRWSDQKLGRAAGRDDKTS